VTDTKGKEVTSNQWQEKRKVYKYTTILPNVDKHDIVALDFRLLKDGTLPSEVAKKLA